MTKKTYLNYVKSAGGTAGSLLMLWFNPYVHIALGLGQSIYGSAKQRRLERLMREHVSPDKKGFFPYPVGLAVALTQMQSLKDMNAMISTYDLSEKDKKAFADRFIPIAYRSDFTREMRDNVDMHLATHGYLNSTRSAILKRVSVNDLLNNPDIVEKAIDFPGKSRSVEWAHQHFTLLVDKFYSRSPLKKEEFLERLQYKILALSK